jgi:hypothetical protein
MKKKILVALMGVMMSSTVAHAEHKLLITDVLEPKQIEGQAQFEYVHTSFDARVFGLKTGKATTNSTESNYSLGVGLGHGLEVTASIPYLFNERTRTEVLGESEIENRDGIGDFALEAKYLLLGGEEERYAVVTGLDLKFDTASEKHAAGTGTTDVAPFIAASTKLGHHFIPYGVYRATLRNHDAPDTHTLSVGVEKEFCRTFTLDAKMDTNFNTATRDFRAYEDFVFELTGYVQVAHNFYLLPTVAYVKTTDIEGKNLPVPASASGDGFRGGLSLYYLY